MKPKFPLTLMYVILWITLGNVSVESERIRATLGVPRRYLLVRCSYPFGCLSCFFFKLLPLLLSCSEQQDQCENVILYHMLLHLSSSTIFVLSPFHLVLICSLFTQHCYQVNYMHVIYLTYYLGGGIHYSHLRHMSIIQPSLFDSLHFFHFQ